MTALRSNTGLAVGAVALGLLIAAAGWFLVVSGQRSEAAELQGQIATVQRDIDERRAAMRQSSPQVSAAVRASDLYRLTKAVPDRVDMPGIILDLNAVATANGVSFESITPSVSVVGSGFDVQPLSVIVEGTFTQVNGFLNGVRKLVSIRRGSLDARGRLFAVETVDFAKSDRRAFPVVKATVTVNAYVHTGVKAPTTPGEDGEEPAGTGTGGTVAAGANR